MYFKMSSCAVSLPEVTTLGPTHVPPTAHTEPRFVLEFVLYDRFVFVLFFFLLKMNIRSVY